MGQRLSGGTEALLRKTSVELGKDSIVLTVPDKYRALFSEAVDRRLQQLAKSLGRYGEVRFT